VTSQSASLADRKNGQASILLVSADEVLSHTRALMLQRWRPVVVVPEVAPDVIAASAWDLLIICQTVKDDDATRLALQMTTLYPGAKVMAINGVGQMRSFHSVQFAINVANPIWLPNAVASMFSAGH
jgi:hypothetical protein